MNNNVKFECGKFEKFISCLDEYLKEKNGKSLRISPDQKEAIENNYNTVCAANAGSGKTMVLALRYLYIIISTDEKILPENILALTFTKKAAAEMRDRIGEYMSLAQRTGTITSKAYESFSNAQITTIDSFLSTVVSAAVAQGSIPIPISFRESDSVDVEKIYHDYKKEETGCIERLSDFTRQDPREIFRMAAEYSIPFKKFNAHYALEKLLKGLESFKDNPSEVLIDFLNQVLGVFSKKKNKTKFEQNIEKIRAYAEKGGYFYLPSKSKIGLTDTQANNLWESMEFFRNSCNGNSNKEIYTALAAHIQKLQCAIIYNSNPKAYEQCADDINNIVSYINDWKLERGVFTYTDIAYIARYILANNKGVRDFFGKKIRKIMIDEFQDDNELQKEILYLLSKTESSIDSVKPDASDLEDGKLFFVGDDKQSIYRFRGADVSVFNELPEELGLSEPLSIRKNFRSSQELINFFNHVFRHNCFSSVEKRENYEADFSKEMEINDANDNIGRIELAYNISNGIANENARKEACFIADSILKKVRNEGASFKDIMILYRSKTNKGILEKELNRHGIPYIIDGPSDLGDNAIAGDFASLFSAMCYPDDKVSRIALLISPFVQLSRVSACKLMADSDAVESIFSNGELQCTDLIEQGEFARLLKFHADFNKWHSMLNSIPLTELLNRIWLKSGYRDFLIDHDSEEFCVHFDYLFAIADTIEKQGGRVTDFLSVLRDGTFDRMDLDYLPSQEDAVQLMTIHKSKGLESKILYIYEFGKATTQNHPERERLPLHVIENNGSFYFAPVISDCIFKDCDEAKELAENKRLFYVALTRAKNELIMVSSLKNNSSSGEFLKWILNTHSIKDLSKEIAGHREFDGYTIELNDINREKPGQIAICSTAYGFEDSKKEYSLDAGIVSKGISLLDSFSISSEGKTSKSGIDAIIMENPDKFGTLVHAILEHKISGRKVEYDYDFYDDDKLNSEILIQAEKLAGKFIDSDFAKNLFDRAERILTEQRFFIGKDIVEKALPDIDLDANVYEGVIDLVVVKHDEVIVVDYKTDYDINPENHKNQLAVYIAVAKKVFGKECVKGYLYYLRHGEEREIDLKEMENV